MDTEISLFQNIFCIFFKFIVYNNSSSCIQWYFYKISFLTTNSRSDVHPLLFTFSARAPPSDQGPKAGVQSSHGTGDRLTSHATPQHTAPQGEQGQGHVARKSLQVDVGSSRTGRSPSVSPDRGSVPTSPYSVPQIAPMPSSKLCPVCKTTDLMGTGDDKPNFNTCTQCRSMVCNQCGFNPNPHLTEVSRTAWSTRRVKLNNSPPSNSLLSLLCKHSIHKWMKKQGKANYIYCI